MEAHERIVQEFSDGLVQLYGVTCQRLEDRTEIGSALRDEFFWNSVGMQKGTEAQQFGSSRVDLFDLLKRERPGGGNRLRMIRGSLAPAPVQIFPLSLIKL